MEALDWAVLEAAQQKVSEEKREKQRKESKASEEKRAIRRKCLDPEADPADSRTTTRQILDAEAGADLQESLADLEGRAIRGYIAPMNTSL